MSEVLQQVAKMTMDASDAQKEREAPSGLSIAFQQTPPVSAQDASEMTEGRVNLSFRRQPTQNRYTPSLSSFPEPPASLRDAGLGSGSSDTAKSSLPKSKRARTSSFLLVQNAPLLPATPELPDFGMTMIDNASRMDSLVVGETRTEDRRDDSMPRNAAAGASATTSDIAGNYHALPMRKSSMGASTFRPQYLPPPMFSPCTKHTLLPPAVIAQRQRPPPPPPALDSFSETMEENEAPAVNAPLPPPMPLMSSPSTPAVKRTLRMRKADTLHPYYTAGLMATDDSASHTMG